MSTMQVKVDGVDYATFAEALNNVQDGSVVELLADVVNETVQDYNLTVKLTINGNGFKMENVHLNPQADLVLDKIAFAGDSTVNASNANCKSLTITNCTADVTPAKEGFHPTFVNLGTSEYNVGLSLTMTGNTILVDNDAAGYGKAVFGWRHLDNVTISNNTFGSEAEPLEKIAVKLMNFNEGAEVVIENNTIYGSDAEREFLAIDLYQNNSRANNYTAEIGGNTVVNVNKKAGNGFSFALVECNNFNAGMYGNGSVQIMADNTMNGKAVTMDDVKRDSSSPDGDYDYIGVNVTKDENGKITGGTFRVGEQGKSEFEDALASGVIAGEANADGLYELVQVDLSTIYVDAGFSGNYGDEVAEGKYFGVNAFSNLDDVFAADLTGDVTVNLLSDVAAYKKVNTNYASSAPKYHFVTDLSNVTIDFQYSDNWNNFHKYSLGENIVLNCAYLYAIGGDIEIAGTVNTNYYFFYGTGAGVTVEKTGVINANVAEDKTVQVKGGTILEVYGEINTCTLNVWTQDVNNSQLIVSGKDAVVNADHIHAWNGKDGKSSQLIQVTNGGTINSDNMEADRGSIVELDGGNVNVEGTFSFGYDDNVGTLTVNNKSSVEVGKLNISKNSSGTVDSTSAIIAGECAGKFVVVEGLESKADADAFAKKSSANFVANIGDKDYFYSNGAEISLSTIYVDSSLAGKNYGDEIAEGKIFGINAFANFTSAFNYAADNEAVSKIEIGSDITETDYVELNDIRHDLSIVAAPGKNVNVKIPGALSDEGKGDDICVENNATLTLGEGVSIDQIDQFVPGYTGVGSLVVNGDITINRIQSWGNSTVTINKTGSVKLSGDDGYLYFVGEHAELNVYGNLTGTDDESLKNAKESLHIGYANMVDYWSCNNEIVFNFEDALVACTSGFASTAYSFKVNLDNSVFDMSCFTVNKGTTTFSLSNDAKVIASSLTVNADGSVNIVGDGGTVDVNGTLTNNGTITVDGYSTVALKNYSGTGSLVIDLTGYTGRGGNIIVDAAAGMQWDGKFKVEAAENSKYSVEVDKENGDLVLKKDESVIQLETVTTGEGDSQVSSNKLVFSDDGSVVQDASEKVGAENVDMVIDAADGEVTDTADIRADIVGKDVTITNNKDLLIKEGKKIDATGDVTIKNGTAVAGKDKPEAKLTGAVVADKIIMTNNGHADVDFKAANMVIANNSVNTLTGTLGDGTTESIVIGAGTIKDGEVLADKNSEGSIEDATISAKSIELSKQQVSDSTFAGFVLANGDVSFDGVNTFEKHESTKPSASYHSVLKVTNGAVVTIGKDAVINGCDNFFIAAGNDSGYFGFADNSTGSGTIDIYGKVSATQINADASGTVNVKAGAEVDAEIICVENGGISSATAGTMNIDGNVSAQNFKLFNGGKAVVNTGAVLEATRLNNEKRFVSVGKGSELDVNGGSVVIDTANQSVGQHNSGSAYLQLDGKMNVYNNGSVTVKKITTDEEGWKEAAKTSYFAIGKDGLLSVNGGTVDVGTLTNNGIFKVTGSDASTVKAAITGNALQLDNGVLEDSEIGGTVNVYGTNNTIKGTADNPTTTGNVQIGFGNYTAANAALNILGNVTTDIVYVGLKPGEANDAYQYKLNIGSAGEVVARDEENRKTADVSISTLNIRPTGKAAIDNATITLRDDLFVRGELVINNSSVTGNETYHFVAISEDDFENTPRVQMNGSDFILNGGNTHFHLGNRGGDSATGNAELVLNDSKITAYNFAVAGGSDWDVSLTLTNNSVINGFGLMNIAAGADVSLTGSRLEAGSWNEEKTEFTGIELKMNGAISMDEESLITAGSITGAGTITVDAKDFSGIKKVIDISDETQKWEVGSNIKFENLGNTQVAYGADGDVTLVNVDTKTLYVNSSWKDYEIGQVIADSDDKLAFGFNAFADTVNIGELSNTTSLVLSAGSYSDFTVDKDIVIKTEGDVIVNELISTGVLTVKAGSSLILDSDSNPNVWLSGSAAGLIVEENAVVKVNGLWHSQSTAGRSEIAGSLELFAGSDAWIRNVTITETGSFNAYSQVCVYVNDATGFVVNGSMTVKNDNAMGENLLIGNTAEGTAKFTVSGENASLQVVEGSVGKGDVTITANGLVTVEKGAEFITDGELTSEGSIIVNNATITAGTVTNNGDFTATNANITADTLTNSNTVAITGGTFDVDNVSNSGDISFAGLNNVVISDLTNSGFITVDSGTLAIGNYTSDGIGTMTAGAIVVQKGKTITLTVDKINNGAGIFVKGEGGTLNNTNVNGDLAIRGTASLTGDTRVNWLCLGWNGNKLNNYQDMSFNISGTVLASNTTIGGNSEVVYTVNFTDAKVNLSSVNNVSGSVVTYTDSSLVSKSEFNVTGLMTFKNSYANAVIQVYPTSQEEWTEEGKVWPKLVVDNSVIEDTAGEFGSYAHCYYGYRAYIDVTNNSYYKVTGKGYLDNNTVFVNVTDSAFASTQGMRNDGTLTLSGNSALKSDFTGSGLIVFDDANVGAKSFDRTFEILNSKGEIETVVVKEEVVSEVTAKNNSLKVLGNSSFSGKYLGVSMVSVGAWDEWKADVAKGDIFTIKSGAEIETSNVYVQPGGVLNVNKGAILNVIGGFNGVDGIFANYGTTLVNGVLNIENNGSDGVNLIGSTDLNNSNVKLTVSGTGAELNITAQGGTDPKTTLLINAGATLEIKDGAALTTGEGAVVENNGKFNVSGAVTVNAKVTGNAVQVASGAKISGDLTADLNLKGNITINGDFSGAVTGNKNITVSHSGSFNLTGGKVNTITVTKSESDAYKKFALSGDAKVNTIVFSSNANIFCGLFGSSQVEVGNIVIDGKVGLSGWLNTSNTANITGKNNAELTLNSASFFNGNKITGVKLNLLNVDTDKDVDINANVALSDVKSINKNAVGSVGGVYFYNEADKTYILNKVNGGIDIVEVTESTDLLEEEMGNFTLAGDLAAFDVTMKSGNTTLKVANGESAAIGSIEKNVNGGVNNVSVGNGSGLTVDTIERMGNITVGKNGSEMVVNDDLTGTSAAETIAIGDNSDFESKGIDFATGKATFKLGKGAYAFVDGDFTVDGANNTITLAADAEMNITGNIINNCGDNYDYATGKVLYAPAFGTTINLGKGAALVVGKIDDNADVTPTDIIGLAGLTLASGSAAKFDKNGNEIAEEVNTIFAAGDVYGTEKNNTINVGNFGIFTADSIDMFDGNDTIKTGSDSDFVVATFDQQGNKDHADIVNVETISIGARSGFAAEDIIGVNKLTTGNGSYDKKTGIATYTVLGTEGFIKGTAKNDTISLGNWNSAVIQGGIDMLDGNDTLKLGSDSILFAGNDPQGAGNMVLADIANVETISIGARSILVAKDITGVNKLTAANGVKDDTTQILATGKITGTAKNDTISLGNWSAAKVGEINLGAGNNTIKIGNNSYLYAGAIYIGDYTSASTLSIGANVNFTASSLVWVNKLTVGNGTTFTIGSIAGSGKNDTITFGNNNTVTATSISLQEGNDTIKIGNDSTVTVSNLVSSYNLGSIYGAETINIGSRSSLIAGTISGGLKKLTAANGSYDKKTGTTRWTELKADSMYTGNGNDSITFGNYNDVDIADLSLNDGNDTLKIGNDSVADFGKVDLGSGNDIFNIGDRTTVTTTNTIKLGNDNDTFKIGNDSTVIVEGSLNFGSGKDTMTIGKNSVVKFKSINMYGGDDTINASKGAELWFDNGAADADLSGAKGSWKNATIYDMQGEITLTGGGSVYANEWDVYDLNGHTLSAITVTPNSNVKVEVWDAAIEDWTIYDGGVYSGSMIRIGVAADTFDKKDQYDKEKYTFNATLA